MPKSNLSKKTANARRLTLLRLNQYRNHNQSQVSVPQINESIIRESEIEEVRELDILQQSIQRENSSEVSQSVHQRVGNRRFTYFRAAFHYDPNYDYINLPAIQIGSMNYTCAHCGAKKWKDETPGLCCTGGKVILPTFSDLPELLEMLILGSHPLSKHFLDNSRKYNTLFQMTSFRGNQIFEGNFMPTFKVQGQVYHSIGNLFPNPGTDPQFLQIYFVSDADQLSLRSNIIPNLNRNLTENLQNMLLQSNGLIKSFKYNLQTRANPQTDDFQLIIHADKVPENQHRGRYNSPTVNEVAVLLVNEDKGPRDIVLKSRSGNIQRVSELHRAYDSLQYPLMFPKGEDGYCINIKLNNSNKYVSCRQFYSYRLMIRENCTNHLHYFKSLFNQYCVDMMAKMETERLSFIRNNQKRLRAENYVHLRDAVNEDGNVQAAELGQHVILPSSFTGSPRYLHEKCQDAMTYVRKYGRPDFFITFTCNPEWPEIKNELLPRQKSFDRHDIISRVFRQKFKKLIFLLFTKEIFGKVLCYALCIEWQKRGLPHLHLLIWFVSKVQPDSIDQIISAEIPDQSSDRLLHEIVCKNMIHGPCGTFNPSAPCMKDGKCTKRYPRLFLSETQTGEDGYPSYRRRSPENGGKVHQLNLRGNTIDVDNRWVVPYSPFLSRCLNAHVNVEFCHSVKAIKYICKYITKGTDQATFSIKNPKDELEKFVNGRYICSSEAVWRFFDFSIHEHYPPVLQLAVHLENNQRVYFTDRNMHEIVNNPPKTTLTAFFDLCQIDEFARTILYPDVNSYYTWSNNKFSRRKRGEDVDDYPGIKKDAAISRVYNVHPNQSECFHLRMLLHHVRGPTSFENLKTVNGEIYPTFKAACAALGLLENDDHWKNTLTDACLSESPSMLRNLFAIILVFCLPSQPQILWETFKKDLCDDILHRIRQTSVNFDLDFSEEIFNRGLIDIEDKVLRLSERYLRDFGMPTPIRNQNNSHCSISDSILRQSFNINALKEYVNLNLPKLVPDQRKGFDTVIDSVLNNRGKIIFLDAPGGTGKTFLLNLILAEVRSKGKLAIAVASSGIAAILLNGGRTAHSTFKFPLNVSCDRESSCSIRKNGPLGKILQEASLLVYDESTMSHRAHIEALNRMLQDIRSCTKPFGGLTVVFAGDFRQTLPVIPRGTRADIIKACLKSSSIWRSITKIHLRTNMRVHVGGGDPEFPIKLLSIGDGTLQDENGCVTIDRKIGKVVFDIHAFISEVYPDVQNLINYSHHWLCERAIVTPRNTSAAELNQIILEKLPGDVKEYRSIDTVIESDMAVHYPQEFLNSLNPSGFPFHVLQLKVGASIILLRNLHPPTLCNGTRLQVKAMRDNVIEATILTGPASGEIALIPRIPMIPTDLPFQFKRLQFPVKLAFAITINKAQGQTFKYVGVDLRQDCFSHGQLYVGLSRTGSFENQTILLPKNKTTTKNVVFAEVLEY